MDCWIPRMYVAGQILVMIVCGILVALGKDSIINDAFLAAAGGITLTQGYRIIAQKVAVGSTPNKPTDTSSGGDK